MVSRIKRSRSGRSDDGFPYREFVNEYAAYNEGGETVSFLCGAFQLASWRLRVKETSCFDFYYHMCWYVCVL